jgi:1-acyl-sn-glycerol-3-phosphate acyltransferase
LLYVNGRLRTVQQPVLAAVDGHQLVGLTFHLGVFLVAAQAAIPIVSVTVLGTRSITRGDQWLPRRGDITVHIGKPVIWPQGPDFAVAIRLRGQARVAMLAHAGEPRPRARAGRAAGRVIRVSTLPLGC